MAFDLRKFLQVGVPALDKYYQSGSKNILDRINLENAMWQRRFQKAEFDARVQHQQAQEEYWNAQTEIALAKAENAKAEGKFKEIKGGDGYYYLYNDKTGEKLETGIKVPAKDLEPTGQGGNGTEKERSRSRYLDLILKKSKDGLSDREQEEFKLLKEQFGGTISPEERQKIFARLRSDPFKGILNDDEIWDIIDKAIAGRNIESPPPAQDTTTIATDTSTNILGQGIDAIKGALGLGGRKTKAQEELENKQNERFDQYHGY